ncbi:MAG: ATP-binding protein [Spirochaetales bacterium]|uniref:Chemotaxis protein CheA n=1 Tax=Candidatus Thalassospirochaeta sargassi TaxID=3119039 RepID=A0AAJ1IFY0_9SPIO|nr:ATP-binding protein [Spirochaetales bacterium]
MTENKLYSTFEQDAKKFINRINESLIKLENEGYSVNEINDIFRSIHSIKSEAAYLDLEDITEVAHNMESAIEPLRNVGLPVEVDPALIEFCFESIDKIGSLAIEMLLQDEEDTEPEEILDEGLEGIEGLEDVETTSEIEVPYTGHEIMLIREAMARGEALYQLTFKIASDETMKYPRAYLAVSNLEQAVNVIKVSPQPDEIDNTDEDQVSVVLTSLLEKDDVLDKINIDQLENIVIDELSYSQELENNPVKYSLEERKSSEDDHILPVHDRVISVEADEIDAISNYVSEIKKRLTDLSSAVGADTKTSSDIDFEGLENISDSIESMMANLKSVEFVNYFSGLKRTVRDTAIKTGKRAELKIEAENLRLPRDLAEFIREPLLQLVRNAVVHGIELPSQRGEKSEIGSIMLKAFELDGYFNISVSDDGAGIDLSSISEKYGSITNDEQLFELLIQPGYTTLAESKQFGGRGVGLDLTAERIKSRGGIMKIENKPGSGFSVFLKLKA